MTRRIGILGFEGVQALDIIGPADAFGSDALRDEHSLVDGQLAYEVVIIGLSRYTFTSSSGVGMYASYDISSDVELDTLIVPGGAGLRERDAAVRAADWITAREPKIRRIASVCTGIYGLAATGLLDGRRVTTHWSALRDVQSKFRHLRIDPEARVTRDGKFYSSAGITAGIDLALMLIEEDLGRDAALAVAQEMAYSASPAFE
jgi:transcriptional regulator GlxA family with amidase domain